MIVDLKNRYFGCILPRCVLDLTTEVQYPAKQKIRKLHNRLMTVLYITTRIPANRQFNESIARTVELCLRPGSLRYRRLWRASQGTMSRGRSFCPRHTNDEDTSEW